MLPPEYQAGQPACCDILVGALSYCREYKGPQLYGWVIMRAIGGDKACRRSLSFPRAGVDSLARPFSIAVSL
jgi:hypothetical protein